MHAHTAAPKNIVAAADADAAASDTDAPCFRLFILGPDVIADIVNDWFRSGLVCIVCWDSPMQSIEPWKLWKPIVLVCGVRVRLVFFRAVR